MGLLSGQIAWYRWRAEEVTGQLRVTMDENRRLRRVVKAMNGETDE